jgi:hypothetical protein
MIEWISSNIWLIVLSLVLLFLLYLFVWVPIQAWRRRRRLKGALHELLGDQFREGSSFVTSHVALALDENGRRFVCATKAEQRVVMKADDIIDLIFRQEKLADDLTIVTNNKQWPLIRFVSIRSAKLAELHSRLKRMRETRETKVEPETKSLSSAEGERIEMALGQLTNAVSSLSDAIRQLSLRQKE